MAIEVSVPFNAGRGLMRSGSPGSARTPTSFSTLQCGSWIDASLTVFPHVGAAGFSTLQCGSWIDAYEMIEHFDANALFQYPSMRVVD